MTELHHKFHYSYTTQRRVATVPYFITVILYSNVLQLFHVSLQLYYIATCCNWSMFHYSYTIQRRVATVSCSIRVILHSDVLQLFHIPQYLLCKQCCRGNLLQHLASCATVSGAASWNRCSAQLKQGKKLTFI